MKYSIDEITVVLNGKSQYLKDKYKIKKMGVFGSSARGDRREESDIDIIVEFSKPVSFFEFIELEDYLSKTLKQKVDLVTKKAIKPAIKKDVLRQVHYV